MSGSNEEFDFTTRAPQQIQSGTIFGRGRNKPVSPENPQVRYIATRGTGGGRTVGYFELNDGVNPPARITDEAARSFIQTNRLGSINTDTNVLPTLPPGQERPPRSNVGGGGAGVGAQGVAATPAPKTVVDERLRGEGVNTNTELTNTDGTGKARTSNSAFSTGVRTTGAFNIGRFRSEVSGADSVLPTHSFLVVFAPMTWTRKKFSSQNLDSLLTMRCDNVVLPSVNLLQEQNIRRYGFGPVENVAYGVNVGDFTLQFIVDKGALVVEFFEEWLNTIVNRDSFGGAKMNSENARQPYEIAYKDTYNCPNVNVFMYDRAQNAVMEYNIYDVFPTGIQSMNMSWSEENSLMKLNITFSFTDLRIKRVPAKERVDDKSFKDEIIVTARRNSDGTFASSGGAGDPLTTLNSFGGRNLELTTLSNETTIIGDFSGRIRGSVPPIPQVVGASSVPQEVITPTNRILPPSN